MGTVFYGAARTVDRSLLEYLDKQADSNGGVRLIEGALTPNGKQLAS